MANSVSVSSVRRRGALSVPLLLERPSLLGPILVAPAILYILLLVGYPFVLAVYLSMTNTDVGTTGPGRFVGLDNFLALIQADIFWTALRNTIMFTVVAAVFKGLLGTVLAFLLAENLPGTRIFRVIILLPWTIPIAFSSITWKWMFDTQYSIINTPRRKCVDGIDGIKGIVGAARARARHSAAGWTVLDVPFAPIDRTGLVSYSAGQS